MVLGQQGLRGGLRAPQELDGEACVVPKAPRAVAGLFLCLVQAQPSSKGPSSFPDPTFGPRGPGSFQQGQQTGLRCGHPEAFDQLEGPSQGTEMLSPPRPSW